MILNQTPGRSAASQNAPVVQLHLAVVLFGAAGWLGDGIAASALCITLGRCLIAALCLYPLWLLRRKKEVQAFTWKALAAQALPGLLLALHWTSFFRSVQLGGVPLALLSYASFPVGALLLDMLPMGNRAPVDFRRALPATALSLAGVLLLAWRPQDATGSEPLQGLFFGLISGLLFACLAWTNGRMLASRSALGRNLAQLFFAALLLLPFAGRELVEMRGSSWVNLLLLAIICTAIGHGLFIKALDRVSLHLAARVAALEPLYGILLVLLLTNERPGPALWIALPFLIAGALRRT